MGANRNADEWAPIVTLVGYPSVLGVGRLRSLACLHPLFHCSYFLSPVTEHSGSLCSANSNCRFRAGVLIQCTQPVLAIGGLLTLGN